MERRRRTEAVETFVREVRERWVRLEREGAASMRSSSVTSGED